jgi:hypothetical protein
MIMFNTLRMEECIERQIYLIEEDSKNNAKKESLDSYADFKKKIFHFILEKVLHREPRFCSCTITEEKPPAVSVVPFSKRKIAALTVSTEIELPFSPEDCVLTRYSVKTAYPVRYERSWDLGERTPGAGLLTLFGKKEGITEEEFFQRWYGSHTPLSLDIHPLWNYARSEVIPPIQPEQEKGEGRIRGIVEEQMREEKDLLNPVRFFGGPLLFPFRMVQVLKDVKTFIDMKSMTTFLVREYVLSDGN